MNIFSVYNGAATTARPERAQGKAQTRTQEKPEGQAPVKGGQRRIIRKAPMLKDVSSDEIRMKLAKHRAENKVTISPQAKKLNAQKPVKQAKAKKADSFTVSTAIKNNDPSDPVMRSKLADALNVGAVNFSAKEKSVLAQILAKGPAKASAE